MSWMLARIWTRSGMTWAELTFCLGLLVAVGAVVYMPHVRNGGFYTDDWANAADYRYHGLSFAFTLWHEVNPGRPLAAVLLLAPYGLFGNDPQTHLAMAVGLGIAVSLCFYVLLRELSMEPIHAAFISVLSLLFPWSDAARLWPTASINNISVCAYLLGTTVAVRALRLSGRKAVLVHCGALALYLASLLVYEVAGLAIVLSIVLYRTRASFRRAALPWLADVALVLGVLGTSAIFTSKVRHVGSVADRISDIPAFTTQGVSIFASTFLPHRLESSASKDAVAVVIALLMGWALWAARDPSRTNLRRWLRIFGLATLGVAAAYFMFLGSFFLPVHEGIGTRMHTFAGLAFAVLCYATIVIAVELLARRRSTVLVIAASSLLALGFANRVRADIGRWDRATDAQQAFLVAFEKTMPRPPSGSTIFSFGYPGSEAPGIPIFTHDWDLNGALRLTFDDPSLFGRPIYEPGTVVCNRAWVYPTDLGIRYGSPYRRAIFVDVVRNRAVRIDSQESCVSHLERFVPGPAQRE